jgi:hypothetical protein
VTLGPLVPADETLNHQIVDTFATVAESDRSWTEKVCAMACARDGSVQVAFGLGKYPNRDVLDAYAGVSRGVEQWTVRGSRRLSPERDRSTVGPVRCEVVEPLQVVRFALDENDVVPVSFDWTFEGAVPPALEHREVHRARDGGRIDANVVRYHHIGTAHGWVSIDGERSEFDTSTWVSTRDHSWGVRYMVGVPPTDVDASRRPGDVASLILWSPMLLERPDGSRYGIHVYFQRHTLAGWQQRELQGGIEHPDGHREPFVSLEPGLEFDDATRRLRGGTLHATMADGTERVLTVSVPGDTGFHLGAGLYFGFDGHWHGEWRGELHVDGEHISDCADSITARRLHQMRDCVIQVDDLAGGGAGWGNLQSIVTGPHPDLGLTADASFL